MKRKIFFSLSFLIALSIFGAMWGGSNFEIEKARAQEANQESQEQEEVEEEIAIEKVPIEVFVRPECKHCQAEKEFFLELQLRRDDFSVRFHNIKEPEHFEHWRTLTELEHLPKVTPITLVGNTLIEGFDSSETTGVRIETLVNESKGKHTMNFEAFIQAGGSGKVESVSHGTCDESSTQCEVQEEPLLVRVPILGAVDLKNYSLLALSAILGFVDGFNPCAMWVLVTFLVILIQVGNRKKMWQIAGLFIAAETVMYYLILNFWFTLWDFVGLDKIITPIVGIVAIGSGAYFLYEWKNSKGECKVIDLEKRTKTRSRIESVVKNKFTLLTALGIIGLALSVNVIEFACSIGIPQTFTKVLEMNQLNMFWREMYMFLYILFYMIDDFIVFGIALYSVEKIGITTKYSRFSNLIGGILMILLGLILIFKRTWLVF